VVSFDHLSRPKKHKVFPITSSHLLRPSDGIRQWFNQAAPLQLSPFPLVRAGRNPGSFTQFRIAFRNHVDLANPANPQIPQPIARADREPGTGSPRQDRIQGPRRCPSRTPAVTNFPNLYRGGIDAGTHRRYSLPIHHAWALSPTRCGLRPSPVLFPPARLTQIQDISAPNCRSIQQWNLIYSLSLPTGQNWRPSER